MRTPQKARANQKQEEHMRREFVRNEYQQAQPTADNAGGQEQDPRAKARRQKRRIRAPTHSMVQEKIVVQVPAP